MSTTPRPARGSTLHRKPKFGRLHTRHASPRLRPGQSGVLQAREGAGDYRHVVPGRFGQQVIVNEAVYRPIRNGLPVEVPYRWRAPGWERRLQRSGLDLAAIAAADADMRGARPWIRPRVNRAGE